MDKVDPAKSTAFPRVSYLLPLAVTGLHTCEDVYCITCNTMVGWEYVSSLCIMEHRGSFMLGSGFSV